MLIEFDETADGVARLLELDRIESLVHALRADAVVDVVDVRPRVDEYAVVDAMTGEQRRILIEDAARDELACALRRSSRVMQDTIDTARTLVGLVPEVLAALKDGQISLPHARIIADAAERLPAHVVEKFVSLVLPTARRGTLAATRKAVKRAIAELDGEGETRRREQAKCSRDVWVTPDVDGMSLLIARMTTEDAHACKTQIDADGLDRAYSLDAKAGLTMGEHRVEALAALILGGNGQGTAPKTAHVNLTIDLPTFVGLRDGLASGSAELTGAGPVSAAVVRDLLQDPDTAVTIRRLVTDPITGHLLGPEGKGTATTGARRTRSRRDYATTSSPETEPAGSPAATGEPTSHKSTTPSRGMTAAKRSLRISVPYAPGTIN